MRHQEGNVDIDSQKLSRYDLWMAKGPKGEQRHARREQLKGFARDAGHLRFGAQQTDSCTSCAYLVVEHFGGQVRGYFYAHNEMARIGDTEGGHDFAITPDGFLVDAWVFHCCGEEPVLDLSLAHDRAEALARYGPDENWQKLPELPAGRRREHGREHPIGVLKAG